MDNKKVTKEKSYFYEINKSLLNIGATYTSLLILDNNNSIVHSKSSDLDWAEEFTSTGMYKHCHLLQAANNQMHLHAYNFSILWDLYSPQTDKANELEEIRKFKNITHGVGFCVKNNNFKIMLNIAGKYTDVNFGLNVLKQRGEVYRELKKFIATHDNHKISR